MFLAHYTIGAFVKSIPMSLQLLQKGQPITATLVFTTQSHLTLTHSMIENDNNSLPCSPNLRGIYSLPDLISRCIHEVNLMWEPPV